MGMYDIVDGVQDPYDDQFKLWDCDLTIFRLGSEVPPVRGAFTYSVILNTYEQAPPMYLLVRDGKIAELMAKKPLEGCPVFSKWGGHQDQENPVVTAMNNVSKQYD